jgi:hypothetical protein
VESPFGSGLGDEFSHTDLVSNHTVFKDQECYQALLQGQDLPVHIFSSFIHEATHHWCFISPVGTALSFLYLSVAKKAIQWIVTEDESQRQEALRDLCTFEIAVSWLRPLNEGLAQFAEYDVLLSASAVRFSPPLLATLNHLFNLPRRLENVPRDDRTPSFYELMDAITKWRLSRQVIERKSELLLQPIGSQGSAYLLGYLGVKQIWKSAARFYEELKDADVFLMFIRRLVFGDYAMIADILDRKLDPLERGLRFGRSLFERMHAIRSGDFATVPWREWEALLTLKPLSGRHRYTYDVADPVAFAYPGSEELARKGTKLYDQYHLEVIHLMDLPALRIPQKIVERFDLRSDQLPANWFPPDYFFNVLQERYLMWLGDVSVKWESTGPQVVRFMVGSDVVIDNFKLPGDTSDERLKDLKLDIYLDLYELYLVATIGNESDILGLRFWGNISKQAKSKLKRHTLNRRKIVKDTSLVHELTRAYVIESNFRELIDKFWTVAGRDLLDKTYMGFAFNGNEAAQSVFVQRGLADILQNDPELVRNVAAISLAASAEMSPEGLLSACRDLTLNPLEVVQKVKPLWPFDDLPFASIGDDGFLSSAL